MEIQAISPVGQAKRLATVQEWYAAEPREMPDLSAVRVTPPPKAEDTGFQTSADRFKEQLQERLRAIDARLMFKVDDVSGRLVAEVRDRATGELLRQVPPEEMMRIARAVTEYLGLLVDERR
ncbi:MAG: flagellar protein FlaG [Chloroflexota bacterium]